MVESSSALAEQSPSLAQQPSLVLNADFRPVSYYPLSLLNWQDSIKAVFLDRVYIVSEYDSFVHSPTLTMRLPSVIALKHYISTSRNPSFTRFNVFLRDGFCCQYCTKKFATHDLTFDHVIPRSRGGRTEWDNVVTACSSCNLRKSNHLPQEIGMNPIQQPHAPTVFELQKNGRNFPSNYLHHSWRDYLYWDEELEIG